MPFRDRRLLDLFATMPAGYLQRGGLDRAPARMMLKGRLPDSVRLRRTGGPFSPDFLVRAQRQALPTIDRIAAFRATEANDWLDLAWLERELRLLSVPGAATYERVHQVQATTGAASYFEWLSRQ
jgi:asparagine synthase (glutamine-hydrolysing)